MDNGRAGSAAALAVLTVGLVAGCAGSPDAPSAARSARAQAAPPSSSAPSPSPSPAAPAATPSSPAARAEEVAVLAQRPGALPPHRRLAAPVVAFDAPAAYPDGVTLHVREVTHTVSRDSGPGAQPGQPVSTLSIELVNGSADPVDLSGVVVAATHGADRAVADLVYGDGQQDFSGVVASGGRAEAVYAFAIPREARGAVILTLDLDGRHAPAVWRGAVT